MNETALALMDSGEANLRVLSNEQYRADFRRVEAASLKRKTYLASAEGKRMFARCFYGFQVSIYFISTMGRTKLPRELIEQIEEAIRARVDAAMEELNKAIDQAELLLKKHNIDGVATYDTVPLEVEVAITSALGRRYFEALHKLDQIMPLIQTLEIEEAIREKQADMQRSHVKRVVISLCSVARTFAAGVKRRMNAVDARRAAEAMGERAAALAPEVVPQLGDVATGDGDAVAESTLTEVLPSDAQAAEAVSS